MIETTRAEARTRVLLVRDMPEQRLRSMERLADEIERGFAGHERYQLTATALHASRTAGRVGLAQADSYFTRFVRYPLAVKRTPADVYHIVDHGYAHAAALLPPRADRDLVSRPDAAEGRGGAGGLHPGTRAAGAVPLEHVVPEARRARDLPERVDEARRRATARRRAGADQRRAVWRRCAVPSAGRRRARAAQGRPAGRAASCDAARFDGRRLQERVRRPCACWRRFANLDWT